MILNPATDNLEVEEPAGWSDIALEITRDPKYHGISIAHGLSDLRFTGQAAWFIRDQYEAYGIDAKVDVLIIAECDGVSQYEELFQIDFGQYEEELGGGCAVKVGIEQASCFVKFAAGMDKKVDLEATTTFGGLAVPDLPQLKQKIALPSQTVVKSTYGVVPTGAEPIEAPSPGSYSSIGHVVRPVFPGAKFENIKTSQLSNPSVSFVQFFQDEIVSPFVLYEDDVRCFSGSFGVAMRMKGTVLCKNPGPLLLLYAVFIKAQGDYRDVTANIAGGTPDARVLAIQNIVTAPTAPIPGGATYGFDLSFNDPAFTLVEGDCLWGFILAAYQDTDDTTTTTATFDTDTFVDIEALVNCPPSEAHVFLPYETIQRVADVITDGCLRVESTWYGRTEHGYGEDGCGAFRSLTGGLYLRGAPQSSVFLSMKEGLEGLRPVDATGFALERDEAGAEILRIEHVSHFYQDVEILRLDNVPGVRLKAVPDDIPGTVKVGYEKWKTEKVNGLYEYNSTRDFRSSVTAATATFDAVSKFIAAGTIIEVARQETFAQTGAADTAYDDDIFLIQLKRGDSGFEVEQGVPEGAAEIIGPETVYNFRLTPARNLLRWWPWLSGMAFRNTIIGSFRFASGTGNYRAEGFIPGDCSPETGILAENELVFNDIVNEDYDTPLARAESVTFDTTMSLADFKMLRANPYGYVSYQCGTGEWRKGYITKVTYHVAKSTAAFELRSKYE